MPASSALHLSVGAHENVATSSEEDADNPSVPQADYERGIGVADSCDFEEPDPEADPEEAQQALEADAFCDKLLYHEGTGHIQESPKDQDIRSDRIAHFDVIWTSHAGTFTAPTCDPFCKSNPAGSGDTAWNTTHTVGESAGLTEGPDEADDETGSERANQRAAFLAYPQASSFIQQNTDAWEMNGWMNVNPSRTYIGFLEDDEGQPISEDDLKNDIIPNDEGLSERAAPLVCGFSDDVALTSSFTGVDCTVRLTYQGPSDGDTSFTGYDDECESPTYVCGEVGGGAWYGVGSLGPIASLSAQDDYLTWHWVVAPTTSACDGRQAPGVTFETPGDAEKPYLAHDLDVYTPPTDLSAVDNTESTPLLADYVTAVANNATGEAADTVNEALDNVPDLDIPALPGEVTDTVNDTSETAVDAVNDGTGLVVNASWMVSKTPRIEPNNAEPVEGLDDTSQSAAENLQEGDTLHRTVDGGPCSLFEDGETEDTVDPWVDYIDANAWADLGAAGASTGLYNNEDRSQDQHNNPTTSFYYTSGQIGFFADKDDSGAYEQVASSEKYEAGEISENGAYPMLWDMYVDDQGVVDTSGGCTFGTDDQPLPEVMQEMGYGPNTGLVQAIYLQEPTAVMDPDTGDVVPYADGNNILLLMSQAAHELVDLDSSTGYALDTQVDNLLEDLKDYAVEKGAAEDPNVIVPANDFGHDSDFSSQCGQATGGFATELSFLHDCNLDCEGDTIATMYSFELTRDTLKDDEVPGFSVDDQDYEFGQGQHTWIDIDPFDGNPDRNSDESSAPPT